MLQIAVYTFVHYYLTMDIRVYSYAEQKVKHFIYIYACIYIFIISIYLFINGSYLKFHAVSGVIRKKKKRKSNGSAQFEWKQIYLWTKDPTILILDYTFFMVVNFFFFKEDP